jgi:replicative DNA helicase
MTDIEKLTIHYLLYSPDSVQELLALGIDTTYFNTPNNQDVANTIFEYVKNYKEKISPTALQIELERLQFPQNTIKDYIEFNPDELSGLTIKHLADRLIENKESKIIENGLSAASNSHRSSDLHSTKNTLNTLVRDLAQVEKTHSPTIDLKQDIGNIIENYKIPKNTKSILTGYPEIDDLVGGFKPGWLVLVAAAPKIGKTRTLVNLACGMVKRKANVLIFTLEVPKDQYLNLCMSCFSGIPYAALDKHTLTQEESQKLSQVQYEIENNYGELTIVDTLGGCTPNFIQAELEKRQLEKGIKYDVVVVDHGTMMRPNDPSNADHIDQAHIAEDLRAIARKHKITVLAAVQRKNDESRIKKALKQNKDDVKPNFDVGGESIGRSYVWYQTADVLFIIQNDQPDSLNVSPLRFSALSRYNSNYSFELAKDFAITSLKSTISEFAYKGLWNKSKLG